MNARLSSEDSAEHGRYRTSRAPYQKAPQDAITDPNSEIIALMWSGQTGKSLIAKNIIGYHIDKDPCSMLYIMPNEKLAQRFSKRRLTPMLRDTPCLRGKVRDARAKGSTNAVLEKTFAKGGLTIATAGAAADLISQPNRIVIADEPDRYPASASNAGDPIELARQRTQTFANRKIIILGTPGYESSSRIAPAYEESSQGTYAVPCPHCGTFQVLKFAQFKWDRPKVEGALPDEVWYECEKCNTRLTEGDRLRMVEKGKWQFKFPERIRRPGFWLWEAYSPWSSLKQIVHKFLSAKRSNDPNKLMQVANEVFCELWNDNEESIKVSELELENRVEEYVDVPAAAYILTFGADVHPDRIEVEVDAWGPGEESWLIHHEVLVGSPEQQAVWRRLDEILTRTWLHESGAMMKIDGGFIDSGTLSDYVYAFTKPRYMRNIFSSKGRKDGPIVGKPTKNNRAHALLFSIGTDVAKTVVMTRLNIKEQGAGYMHFNHKADSEYFLQLTAEKFEKKFYKGRMIRRWKQIRPRNEALDLKVMNLAMITRLNPDWIAVKKNFDARIAKVIEKQKAEPTTEQQVIPDTEHPISKKNRIRKVSVSRRRNLW